MDAKDFNRNDIVMACIDLFGYGENDFDKYTTTQSMIDYLTPEQQAKAAYCWKIHTCRRRIGRITLPPKLRANQTNGSRQ